MHLTCYDIHAPQSTQPRKVGVTNQFKRTSLPFPRVFGFLMVTPTASSAASTKVVDAACIPVETVRRELRSRRTLATRTAHLDSQFEFHVIHWTVILGGTLIDATSDIGFAVPFIDLDTHTRDRLSGLVEGAQRFARRSQH